MAEQQEFLGNARQDPKLQIGEGVEGLTVWDKYPRGRNHPNQPESDEDFKDWMITAPNSMVEEQAFAVGATIDDTVTPANPTPPTNIQYWGETPPNSPEMVAAFTPAQDTYIAEDDPRRSEEPAETKDQSEARLVHVHDFEGNREEVEDAEAKGVVPRLVQEEPTKFAPNQGGMAHEAAGTEEVQNMEYQPSGETEPVQIPIAVSAGVVDYTRAPNATHPSNEDPQPTEPPPGGGTDGGGTEPEPETPIDLTSLTPETAVAGSGTFALTVNGTGFDDTCVILFKDAPVATTFVSETELRADAAPVSATPETVDVEVQRGDDLSDVLTFDFTAAGREGEEGRRKSERKPSKKQKSARGGKGSKTAKKSKR